MDRKHKTHSCRPHSHSPRLTGGSSALSGALQLLASCPDIQTTSTTGISAPPGDVAPQASASYQPVS